MEDNGVMTVSVIPQYKPLIAEFKDIDKLSSSDFEIFVRDLFVASGWTDAEITQTGKEFKHGDGGVDIFAWKGRRKFAIEVKQRQPGTTVDVKALNQLVTGATLANVTYKILVTNSWFTSEVKARALRLGVELIDRDELQNLWVIKHSEIGRDIKPRTYQQDVINEALALHAAGKSKLLIEMATGLGKTYTVAHLIKRLIQQNSCRPRVLFLAHQVEILLQSVTAFKNVLGIGNYSFSACFGGTHPEETDFVFASFDTLYSKLDALSAGTFDYVIVDEAHHTLAKTYSAVVSLFQPQLLIGLTATPYRTDNRDVVSFFGGADGHIGKFDLVWALKNKKLAFPKYLVLLDDLDQDKIDQLESGLSLSDIDKLLFLHKKDHEIVRLIDKTVTEQGIEDVKGIIFCRNIQHMNHLIAFFEPGTATLVHSKMYDQERRENIRLFREGDYKYILVCDLFNEGIDIPETNLLIFMRYTGSRTIWLQQLGRGLRKTPNKEFVHVLDFVGSLERLNEIKCLAKEIEQQPRYHNSTIDDPEEMDAPGVYHDTSLEVQFSAEAAKVLALLEEMKMQLNSRDVLLDKLRRYREKNDELPSIAELEQELDDVSLDQIATHFGSYLSYLTAAFNEDVDIPSMRTRLIEFLDTFIGGNNMAPSFYTISLNFGVNPLYEFTEKEIQQLLPDYDNLVSARIKVTAPQDVSDMPLKEEEVCPWIETYRGQSLNLASFKQLPSDVQEEIKNKYQSAFVFLKKLKDAL